MTATVTVKVTDFRIGVKYAKKMGGRFCPATKTWSVPADARELGALGSYGLALVTSPVIDHDDTGNAECFANTWQQAFR